MVLFGDEKDGVYTFLTYHDVKQHVDEVRGGLHSLGIKKGDSVAIISRNRLEWVTTAYASYGLQAMVVPMYEQQKQDDWKYIISDSKAKVVIVSTEAIYEKVS